MRQVSFIRFLSTFRVNARPRFANNGRLLSGSILEDWQLPMFRTTDIVRMSAYGELHNKNHLVNYCRIASIYKETIFALFTKRKRIIQFNLEMIPANIILVFSNYFIDRPLWKVPKGFHKVFNVYTVRFAIENGIDINCMLSCRNCMKCYGKEEPSVMHEIIKREKKLWGKLQ